MTNHLLRRGSRYYIRRKVPTDLQGHYEGRKEIVKALGTSDPTQARECVRAASVQLDREFAALRQQPVYVPETVEVSEYIADPVTSESVPTGRTVKLDPRYPSPYSLGITEDGGKVAVLWPIGTDDRYHKQRLKHARAFANGVLIARAADSRAAQPSQPTTHAKEPAIQGSASAGHLAALVEKWANERKPTGGAVEQMSLVTSRFYEHVGRIPVASITRQHAVTLKDKLLASGLAASSTKRYMNQFFTLMKFAYENALIAVPIPRVAVVVKRAEKARISFDAAALTAIFSSPVYTQNVRPIRGAGEAAYWIPLLAAFTGGRVEELCQLAPDDVFEEADHWCVKFVHDEERGQRVKNAGSVRRIPLHAELVRLGFVEYVRSRKGKPRLFDLKPDRHGRVSPTWAKWFSEYLRRVCGVMDARMTFHSFRHTFKDACRASGISREVSDALTGHSDGSASSNYGAEFYPLAPLVDAVARFRIDGLHLPS